jgi:hypothetical protein
MFIVRRYDSARSRTSPGEGGVAGCFLDKLQAIGRQANFPEWGVVTCFLLLYYVNPGTDAGSERGRHALVGFASGGNFGMWYEDKNLMIACCTDGTRPVTFKIEKIVD